MNQEDLAHKSKVVLQTIKNYENGRSWPGPENIEKMAAALECDPTEFFRPKDEWPQEKIEPPPTIGALSEEIAGLRSFVRALGYDPENIPNPVHLQEKPTQLSSDLSEINDIIKTLLEKPKFQNPVRSRIGLPEVKESTIKKKDIG
jgi:transcriptional regulator with XRE-family HTH domain